MHQGIGQGKPVIVLGAGTAGANLVRELARSSEWRLVGLLDDDPAKRGREILDHKVLGIDQRIAALGRPTQGRYSDHRNSVGIGRRAAACGDHVRSRRRQGNGSARTRVG